jgi:hypothetical protein
MIYKLRLTVLGRSKWVFIDADSEENAQKKLMDSISIGFKKEFHKKVNYPERLCEICKAPFKPKSKNTQCCDKRECRRKFYYVKCNVKEYNKTRYHNVIKQDPIKLQRHKEWQKKYYSTYKRKPKREVTL